MEENPTRSQFKNIKRKVSKSRSKTGFHKSPLKKRRESKVSIKPKYMLRKFSTVHKRVPSENFSKKVRRLSTLKPPLIISCSHRSRKGKIPGNPSKENQDSFIKILNFGPFMHLFGVCDGHGHFGKEISQFVSKRIPVLLLNNQNLRKDPSGALTASILKCNEELNSLDIDVNFSGTTLVLVLIIGKRLYCANVGDSRAVLLRLQQKWKTVALSKDHKPNDPIEKHRILEHYGRVQPFHDKKGAPFGPHRVWLQGEDLPGLAMSRSLGDKIAASVGVVAVPEICEWELSHIDKAIVLGSDGVFEFLGNDDVMELVVPHSGKKNAEAAASDIEKAALNQWERKESVVDDITSICIFLDVSNK